MTNKRGNILVVDDITDNLRVLIEILSQKGYTVRPALNGRSALAAARQTRPDLILLDILMPGMDGYEVCKALKADQRLRDVPVIFLSALDDVADKVKGFAVGGVDYIGKPFQAEELLARVSTHLLLQDLRRDLEEKNADLHRLNSDLLRALDEIKTLRGIIPICASCKKIRDDDDSWQNLESYIRDHSEAEFSHGICPDCIQKLYPDMDLDD